MDGEEIRTLLASVTAPPEMPIPVPPNMSAIPAGPILAAGADPAEVEAWVRSGVEQDQLGIWKSPGGARVAWFKDPDETTLSLTQF